VETVIALLDQFNAEVNLKDSDGNTPLHCVVLCPYHAYKMRDKVSFCHLAFRIYWRFIIYYLLYLNLNKNYEIYNNKIYNNQDLVSKG